MVNFVFLLAWTALAQSPGERTAGKKILVVASMEGSDGIFNRQTQLPSLTAPRWQESRRLMTEDVNAAVDGLLAGGADEVIVLDAYDTGQALSTLDIHPKAILLSGRPMTPTLEMNSTYAGVVFAGLPAMAGAEDAVLAGSYDFQSIHGIWVNGKPTGAIGARAALAGHFGVPVLMMYGDEAASKELRALSKESECAVVKWGIGRGGKSLAHTAAIELIRSKARAAMDRAPRMKPYRISGPVEVKVQFTTAARVTLFRPREGVAQTDPRTWVFRGSDILDAWLKFGDF
ncbi:MAG: M55 family metallopeptidase [Acidobacteria bacterium]|nr:M55 family metallopeptidase [Acidobacteriota bacterium]